MTTQEMVKTGRKKLEKLREVIAFLEERREVFISNFKEIGLDKEYALEYCHEINFFSQYFLNKDIIEITTIQQKTRESIIIKFKWTSEK